MLLADEWQMRSDRMDRSNIGALVIAYIITRVPYDKYMTKRPRTLF